MFLKAAIISFFMLVVFNPVVSGLKQCNDCQRYSLCNSAAQLVLRNQNQDTLEKFRQAQCGFDKRANEVMVCCSDFMVKVDLNNRHGDEDMSDKMSLLPEDCGDTDGRRIIGGEITKIYEFPWMALISYNTSNGIQFQCSGTIINSKYILTAAHCVEGEEIAGVRLGDFDVRYSIDCQGEQEDLVCESYLQDMFVEEIIPHQGYTSSGAGVASQNDIALIRVRGEIDLLNHKNVKPICLPVLQNLRNYDLTGEQATVTGWGLTEKGKESSVLRKVQVPIKSREVCRAFKSGSDTELCAGGLNKDSCKGDSGGPLALVAKYKNVYRAVQFGIVSHGPRFCGTYSPAAYTDLRKFSDWILEHIRA